MQLKRVEAFDLLRFMPAAAAVRLSPELSDVFYRLREQLVAGERLATHEERFQQRYLADLRRTSPTQWRLVQQHVLR